MKNSNAIIYLAILTIAIFYFVYRYRYQIGRYFRRNNPQAKLEYGDDLTFKDQEALVVKWGLATVERRKENCHEFRVQHRDNMTFTYWDTDIDTITMERSDGESYIQLMDQDGKVFGAIFSSRTNPDPAVIPTARSFEENMLWFIKTHTS